LDWLTRALLFEIGLSLTTPRVDVRATASSFPRRLFRPRYRTQSRAPAKRPRRGDCIGAKVIGDESAQEAPSRCNGSAQPDHTPVSGAVPFCSLFLFRMPSVPIHEIFVKRPPCCERDTSSLMPENVASLNKIEQRPARQRCKLSERRLTELAALSISTKNSHLLAMRRAHVPRQFGAEGHDNLRAYKCSNCKKVSHFLQLSDAATPRLTP
jgi:hypothetical protein